MFYFGMLVCVTLYFYKNNVIRTQSSDFGLENNGSIVFNIN